MKPSIDEPYELDAFQRDFIFWEHPKPGYLPPIDDRGQHEWREGFMRAFVDYPDTLDPKEGETAQEALGRLLEGHPALPALKMMLMEMR